MESFPANSLVPFATVAAAFIAGFFSFLNLVISKEQKVSEFRQAWIDKLRDEISQFIAAVNDLSETSQLSIAPGKQGELEYRKAVQSSHLSASHNYTSIVLRINPADSDKEMKQANNDFLSTLQSTRDAVGEGEYEKAESLLGTLRDRAQPILKHEWERVKKGERTYRWSLRATMALIVLALLLGCFLAYRKLHSAPVKASASAHQNTTVGASSGNNPPATAEGPHQP
jgi:hypothetical protein